MSALRHVPRILIVALALCAALGCARKRPERIEWTTMGTTAAFLCRDKADLPLAQTVIAVFGEVERLMNAHDPDSELSRLAPLPDEEVLARCDARMRPCYEAAFRLMRETGGAFSPRWRGPATLDLGGIAKGFALDLAAEAIGERDVLLDLGGNLKVCGGEWKVGVYGKEGEVRRLASGEACATSGEYARGKHIYDGRTGAAVSNTIFSVTLIHPGSATLADGLSTILFILGQEKGEAFLRAHHPDATALWQ